ncbi:Uu.00g141390.m01.CDS01 [Anthostomella pinea]|uniref:Uu.00g141390.m01.CDS01 n=1 Tax=Anthostomella pinea TaxID=933095 RepID=A0AAI8VQ98_9PEZI|nr:Uu.00g141390.m01.CDS01 [Anthostomella pinea]
MHPLNHGAPSFDDNVSLPGFKFAHGYGFKTSQQTSYRCNTPGCRYPHPDESKTADGREHKNGPRLSPTRRPSAPFEPVFRRISSRREADRPSEASADSTSISPFELDPESSDARGQQIVNHEAISTWLHSIVSSSEQSVIRTSLPLELEHSSPLSSETAASEDQLDVMVIIPISSRSRRIHTRGHRSTRSGTGFDGPLSSPSDTQLRPPSHVLGDQIGASMRSAALPNRSQRLKSDTSGSIDWEKSWPKRKPRRAHNVSEVSPDPAALIHAADFFAMVTQKDDSVDDGNADDMLCPDFKVHHAQFHAIQQLALKSCPELHRQVGDFAQTVNKSEAGLPLVAPNYSEFDKSRHRHRPRVSDTLSKGFRSLGRKLYRSGSSSHSARSDFPAPPDGKERRYLARDSTDVWPSSGEESPVFNTPESPGTPAYSSGSYVDPLAMAALMITAADLDRLSGTGSRQQRAGASGSSRSQTPLSSGVDSPINGPSVSGLATPDNTPNYSPSTSLPQVSQTSLAARPPQRPGQRRRAQRSRLSEVTTPEEPGSLIEPVDYVAEPTLSYLSSAVGTLQEISGELENANPESLYPRPLTISREGISKIISYFWL